MVSNVYLGLDWYYLNDGDLSTMAATMNYANAYTELDFGSGGRITDSVVMDHQYGPTDADYLRSNGVTLTVMNDQRDIILSYTFAGYSSSSPQRSTFVLPPI